MSAIDGRKVSYRGLPTWDGIVQGDSYIPGTVRVVWSAPKPQTSVHAIGDLVVLDRAPTQEELRKMAQ